MTKADPTIRIPVDPTNPGQFFACCGLLELADRLWSGAEGWFEAGKFQVASGGTLEDVLHELVACHAEEVETIGNGVIVKPLIAPLKLSFNGLRPFTLTLDAWVRIRIEKGAAISVANPPWNFWSGQQTSFRIWRDLRIALEKQLIGIRLEQLENLFAQRVLLSGRFGFDPGAAWNSIDVGFSPNEQGINVASSAAIELLAAIGIQRFRPSLADDRQSFTYATWGQALAPSVAASAACGAITVPPSHRFHGRVISRASYAALGYSTPIRGKIDE